MMGSAGRNMWQEGGMKDKFETLSPQKSEESVLLTFVKQDFVFEPDFS